MNKRNDRISVSKAALIEVLGSPIAYYPAFAKVAGGIEAGVLASQLFYWTGRGADPEGWIYKTQAEMTAETGLSRDNQETARKKLKKIGVLEEKLQGVPARLHYRLNVEVLFSLVEGEDEEDDPSMWDHTKLDCGDQPNQYGGSHQTGMGDRTNLYTKSTSKSTSKNTAESAPPTFALPRTAKASTSKTGDINLDAAVANADKRKQKDGRRELSGWQAELNLEVPAKVRTPLVDALAEACGLVALINAGDEKTLRLLHEKAVVLHGMGLKTPEHIKALHRLWLSDDWKAKNRPFPKVYEFADFASQAEQGGAEAQGSGSYLGEDRDSYPRIPSGGYIMQPHEVVWKG